ncbi:hypothetical protein NBRC10513v2_003049 [Rhodotorula toruloides]
MARRPPQPLPQAMMTSDELDWLVYSYLEESDASRYHHTSFSLLHESSLAGPSSSSNHSSTNVSPQPNGRSSAEPSRNPVMDQVVPPGHLVRLLQKGLLYLEAEARYRGDAPDPPPRIIGYSIPNSLPLPPLPKYVPPPPAPSAPAPKSASATPPVSGTSAAAIFESAPASKDKGKGKAKEVDGAPPAASGSVAPKKKKAAVAEEDVDGGEAAMKKARAASAVEGTAAGKKGKGKAVERDTKARKAPDDEDVDMEDASTTNEHEVEKPKKDTGKEREDAPPAVSTGAKREREKDDLRPPPAKKSASSVPPTSTSSAAASQPKRSASPVVSRKSKPAQNDAAQSASPSAPGPAPSKFRITMTTKTVSTSVPLQSPSAGPVVSAAQAAADKRRRGSGDSNQSKEGGGERLMKVKTETAESGLSSSSGSTLKKNGVTAPKSPLKTPATLKEIDMRGVKVIGSEDGRVVKLMGHTVAKIQPCSFNSKVPSLATGAADSTCRIWDVPSPPSSSAAQTIVSDPIVCKHASAQRRCDITCVAWNPSGSLLATASEDGVGRIWTPSGDLYLVLSMHQRSICSLKWNPSGTGLLTSSLDQTVCLWDPSNGKVRQQYSTHSDAVLDVDWNDDTTWVSASMDKQVHLMSTTRPTPLHRFKGHRDEVNGVKFSPCGTLIASCSDDTTIRVWSLRNIPAVARDIAARKVKQGDEERMIDMDEEDGGGGGCFVLEGHESDVHQIAWHPEAGKEGSDGPRLLASCSFDQTARLWDADTGTCLYTFARATDFVYSVAFEPTKGRYLATGSNDNKLDVWRVKDRALVSEYTHPSSIYEIAWHPHGQQIAVCGGTLEVAVVSVEEGQVSK